MLCCILPPALDGIEHHLLHLEHLHGARSGTTMGQLRGAPRPYRGSGIAGIGPAPTYQSRAERLESRKLRAIDRAMCLLFVAGGAGCGRRGTLSSPWSGAAS